MFLFEKIVASKINRENFTFDNIFLITDIAMILNRSHPNIKRNQIWSIQFILLLTLSVSSFVFVANSALFYDIPAGRYTEASKNGTMAIIAFTIKIKYAFMLYYQNYMKMFIDVIDKDFKLALDFDEDEKEIVIEYARRGSKVSWYWLIASITTGSIFPLKAFIKMGNSYLEGDFELVPVFDMRYPDRVDSLKNTPAMYAFLFAFCLAFGCYAGSMYIGFDPLVPIFLLHICGQLDILSKRILNTFKYSNSNDEINEKLKEINVKLQDLYWLIKHIKSKFAALFEFNMKVTTLSIPLALFQVAEDLKHYELNLEFMSFFMSHILHFYIPCYYSDNLLNQSNYLREAIYSSGWEAHPDPRARKTILLMMTRTTTPLVLSTIFFPICLDTFAEMCRQAYAIFNIMNASFA